MLEAHLNEERTRCMSDSPELRPAAGARGHARVNGRTRTGSKQPEGIASRTRALGWTSEQCRFEFLCRSKSPLKKEVSFGTQTSAPDSGDYRSQSVTTTRGLLCGLVYFAVLLRSVACTPGSSCFE